MNTFELYHEDCLSALPKIKTGSVDMLLVDLPYGTTGCPWDVVIPMEPLWEEYHRVCKPSAPMLFTSTQPFTTTIIASNISEFRYEWIWEKPQGTNPMHSKSMPLRSHESVLVFYRERPTYNPQMWYSTPYAGFKSDSSKIGEVYGSVNSEHRDNPDGSRYPKTIQKFKQDRGVHPTQKPVSMMEYFIRTYTNDGDTVLDNTMGSGTTGVACGNEGRSFIGIEKDDGYFKIAKERITMAFEMMEIFKL
jgi:site-specific DNA-methyltransferase (adenine-specific)